MGVHGPLNISEMGSGPIFTKLRSRKHKHRAFVCIKIGKVTLDQSAQLHVDSTPEVKFIHDTSTLLKSTTPQVNVCNVSIYVYAHVYEL
jgi:hypothetical protein